MSCAEKPELESGQKEKIGLGYDNFGKNCAKSGETMECEQTVSVKNKKKIKKKRVLPGWMLKEGKELEPLGGEEKINLKKKILKLPKRLPKKKCPKKM